MNLHDLTKRTIITLSLVAMTCGIHAQTSAGRAIIWGYNILHQGTNPAPQEKWTGPLTVDGEVATNIVALSAGPMHAVFALLDGRVYGSGFNYYGQITGKSLRDAHLTNSFWTEGRSGCEELKQLASGDRFNLALLSNGTVKSWGECRVPPGLTNVVSLAARSTHCIALRADGTISTWGSDENTLTVTPPRLKNVVAVGMGGAADGHYERATALLRDGRVVVWSSQGVETNQPPGEVVAIASGGLHHLALLRDGTVFAWGFNQNGEAMGTSNNTEPFQSSGLVILNGQPLSNVVSITASTHYNLATKSDGSVIAWGNKRFFQQVPEGLSNVVATAAGDGFCIALCAPDAVPSER